MKDVSLVKEILRILCNISNTELGKKILIECNAIPYFNQLLQDYTDSSVAKCVVACFANIAICQDLKKTIMENHCLIHIMNAFQRGISELDTDLVKYSLYFIGNMCENCPEAAYILGKIKVIKYIARFFNTKLTGELLADALDSLYVLLQIKENL